LPVAARHVSDRSAVPAPRRGRQTPEACRGAASLTSFPTDGLNWGSRSTSTFSAGDTRRLDGTEMQGTATVEGLLETFGADSTRTRRVRQPSRNPSTGVYVVQNLVITDFAGVHDVGENPALER
jgi:hypothetical protein